MYAGKAAPSWDTKSVDWVPTLHLGHEKFEASSAAKTRADRASRLSKRGTKIAVQVRLMTMLFISLCSVSIAL